MTSFCNGIVLLFWNNLEGGVNVAVDGLRSFTIADCREDCTVFGIVVVVVVVVVVDFVDFLGWLVVVVVCTDGGCCSETDVTDESYFRTRSSTIELTDVVLLRDDCVTVKS